MKQTFKVRNVKCEGCAATLRKELSKEFGDVQVNLETDPREISLEIEDEKIETLKLKLRSLGYPLVTDELSKLQDIGAAAKSFVSCALGKIEKP